MDHGTGDTSFKGLVQGFQDRVLMRRLGSNDVNDKEVAKMWKTFHLKHANLAMTCRPCNLTNK